MSSLPLVFHPDYVCELPPGHRFPMPKFGMIRQVLLDDGVARPGQFHEPVPAEDQQLHLVHDPAYVCDFDAGRLDRDAVRRIGLPWSPALARRTRTAVGGTIRTAELALAYGLACNTAGGTHHAHRDFGSGFCIFNDIAVAIAELRRRGDVDHVLVIDLDVHQGDGTARLFADEPHVFTLSVHGAGQFPLHKQHSSLDVQVPAGTDDAGYLRMLDGESLPGMHCTDAQGQPAAWSGLAALLHALEPDLVFYDAGVDVHAADRLGKLKLTDQGLAARDRRVLQACRQVQCPVACVIGGGYDQDLWALARRHTILHREASACCQGRT